LGRADMLISGRSEASINDNGLGGHNAEVILKNINDKKQN
jgi:hypothetical protein